MKTNLFTLPLTFICATLAISFCVNATKPQEHTYTAESPNIIYIIADDLGYGDLGSYGQQKINTPHLDKLAADGMKFTSHYAGSTVCGPSRTSLLTGLHTGHSYIRGNPAWSAADKPLEIRAEDATVAEMLQDAGYQTAAIGKWGLADGGELNLEAMPNQQGFDYFYGYKTHGDAHHYYWNVLYKNNEAFELEDNDYVNNTGQYTHDLFTQEALSYVNRIEKDRPFFLYLAYTIPHYAITVPDDSKQPYKDLGWPIRKMPKAKRPTAYHHDADGNVSYAGMVSRMDRDIGRLRAELAKLGLDKNTLVIFTSDNGHQYDNEFFDSNGALKGKKRDLYEGGIRVPHIAAWPNKIKAGTETEHVSAFWDVMPTFCQLANVKQCPENDGLSYLPTLVGDEKSQQQHDYLYWEFNERQGPIQAVRKEQWKLVKYLNKDAELYDLNADLSETKNLAKQQPKKVKELMVILENARTEHPQFPLTKRKKNNSKH